MKSLPNSNSLICQLFYVGGVWGVWGVCFVRGGAAKKQFAGL
jgi:hypothetical protein